MSAYPIYEPFFVALFVPASFTALLWDVLLIIASLYFLILMREGSLLLEFLYLKHYLLKIKAIARARYTLSSGNSRRCSIFIRLTFSSRVAGSCLIHLANHFIFLNFNQVAMFVVHGRQIDFRVFLAWWQLGKCKVAKSLHVVSSPESSMRSNIFRRCITWSSWSCSNFTFLNATATVYTDERLFRDDWRHECFFISDSLTIESVIAKGCESPNEKQINYSLFF